MQDRRTYQPFLRSCLEESSASGGSIVDPLFYHFPEDNEAYSDVAQASFVLCSSVLVATPTIPLSDNDTFEAYLPNGAWVDLDDFGQVVHGGKSVQLTPSNVSLKHLREGHIVVRADGFGGTELVANVGGNGQARGAFWLADSGDEAQLQRIELQVGRNWVRNIKGTLASGASSSTAHVSSIHLVGFQVDEEAFDFACARGVTQQALAVEPNQADGSLRIYNPAEGGSIDLSSMESILFGSQVQDWQTASVCGLQKANYKFDELPTTEHLNASSLEATLTSPNSANDVSFPKLKLKLSIYEDEIVRL